jgi:hypothetical protein
MIAENDPAGTAIAFANCVNRYTEHSARLITLQTRYNVNFESDLHIPDIIGDDFSEVEALLTESDIIHFHMLPDENIVLGPLLIREYIKGKGLLHHHHGHPNFMVNSDSYSDKYRRLHRRAVVSTPDLLRLLPEATWMPNPVPVWDVQFLPRPGEPIGDDIRVCQAPTRKYDKHTGDFVAVMDQIVREHPNVQRMVIENQPYFDCLRLKRTCDIVFDHMRGHFGISSLESLSQGKPVIAGLDELNIEQIRLFTGTDQNPWVVARNAEQLKSRMLELVCDADMRRHLGAKGRSFMEKYWTEQHVVKELVKVYEDILGSL